MEKGLEHRGSPPCGCIACRVEDPITRRIDFCNSFFDESSTPIGPRDYWDCCAGCTSYGCSLAFATKHLYRLITCGLLIQSSIASENGLRAHNPIRNRRPLLCLSFPCCQFRVRKIYARLGFLIYASLIERTNCPMSSYSIGKIMRRSDLPLLCAGPISPSLVTLQLCQAYGRLALLHVEPCYDISVL